MREVVTKKPVQKSSPTEDLISFNDLNISDNINESVIEQDLPPSITESTSIEEDQVEYVDHIETELQLIPKSLQALSEMQKLFAFLGNTKRLYGNVSHYVRALNTKINSNSSWEYSDKTFEVFIEMVISSLTDSDEQSDSAIDPHYLPIFRR